MSHTHRSPLRTGVARALRYAPRSARAEHAHAVDDVEGTQHNLAAARAALARVLAEAVS